jgi:hypothetical protein
MSSLGIPPGVGVRILVSGAITTLFGSFKSPNRIDCRSNPSFALREVSSVKFFSMAFSCGLARGASVDTKVC